MIAIASLDEALAASRFNTRPMKIIRGNSCSVGLLILVGMAMSLTRLQADPINITMQSPFLPRSGSGIAATAENTPVELRGILKGDTGPVFGFYDPTKRQGGWIKLNEPGKDFPISVRNYDAANDAVTVEYQGRVMNLKLKELKIDAAPAVAVAGPPRPGPMPGQPAVAQAPTADDTRRLEAVAAEVARRRQARQSAATQQQPGQQSPTTAQPQPAQPARTGNGIGGNR